MAQTIIVYLFIAIVLLLFSYLSARKSNWKYSVVAIIIYSIVFGFRYGVGSDHLGYLESYNLSLFSPIYLPERWEIGFLTIMKFFTNLQMPSCFFFGFIACLQLFLIFYSLRSYVSIYPFLAFTFVFGSVWLTYANGLRQQLAFCVFISSLPYLIKKNVIKHYLLLGISVLMHSSAILLLPIYPLFCYKQDWFGKRKYQFFFLLIAIVLGNLNIVGDILSLFELLIIQLGYGFYIESSSDKVVEMLQKNVDVGVGYYLILFIDLLLIYYNSSIKKFFNLKIFYLLYDLYFLGVLWHYLFISSQLFSRINYYFYGVQYIVASFALCYFYKAKSKAFYLLLVLYILWFVGVLYRMNENTSLFIFNWQKDLFYLKNNL